MAKLPVDFIYGKKLADYPVYSYGSSSAPSASQTHKLEGIQAIIPGQGSFEALTGFLVVEYGYYQNFNYDQGYIDTKVAPMKAYIQLQNDPETGTLFKVIAKDGEKDSLF